VAGALGLCLAWLWRGQPLGRARAVALSAALAVAVAYYVQFLPLALEQLPRLREGGGPGNVRLGPLAVLWLQGQQALAQWGLPAVLLALAGLPRPSRGDAQRLLAACWLAGALLLAVAVVSPLEVRYVYALSAALSCAAASGRCGSSPPARPAASPRPCSCSRRPGSPGAPSRRRSSRATGSRAGPP